MPTAYSRKGKSTNLSGRFEAIPTTLSGRFWFEAIPTTLSGRFGWFEAIPTTLSGRFGLEDNTHYLKWEVLLFVPESKGTAVNCIEEQIRRLQQR